MKNIFLKYLLSSIYMLLIPIAAGLIFYFQAYDIIVQNSIDSVQKVVDQNRDILDECFEDIENASLFLSQNTTIRFYSTLEDPYKEEGFLNVHRVSQLINNIDSDNQFIINFFIYLPSSNLVMAPNVSTHFNEYYGSIFNESHVSAMEWKHKNIENTQGGMFLPVKNLVFRNKTIMAIPYIFSAKESNYQTDMDIIFLINVEAWKTEMESHNLYGEVKYTVLDENDQFIFDTISDFGLKEKRNSSIVEITSITAHNNWKIIAHMPESVISDQLKGIKRTMIIMFFSSLLLILTVMVFITYKNTKPLSDIFTLLHEKYAHDGQSNYMNYIKNSIEKVIEEQQNLDHILESRKPMLKRAFVDKLIHNGFIDEEDARVGLDLIDFPDDCLFFNLVMIRINSSENLDSSSLLVNIRLIDVLEQFFSENRIITIPLSSDRIIIFFGYRQKTVEDCKNTVALFCQNFSKVLIEKLSLFISFACSDITPSLENMPSSYMNISELLEYKGFAMDSNVLWVDEQLKKSNKPYYSSIMENHIMNLISYSKKDELHTLLNKIYNENIKERDLSLSAYRQLICELNGTIYKLMERYDSSFPPDFSKRLESLDLPVLFENLKSAIDLICQENNEDFSNNASNKILDSLKYIDNNFSDITLSLCSLAEKYDLSQVYYSQMFKKVTGKTFINHLQDIRLEEAEKLLLTTKLPIKSVAGKTGYANVKSFMRAFKRKYAIPPGIYRKNSK